MLGRLIHARERKLSQRDKNRFVRPFEWGTSFINEHAGIGNDDESRRALRRYARHVVQHSDEFYALAPPITDYKLTNDVLTWTSAIRTASPENNTARARFFPAVQEGKEKFKPVKARQSRARQARRAVVVLPQWNADAESHVALCRLLNRFGIAALRVTLPFHEARRPPELERADHLVSSNIGRTIQSMRQAVLDTRAGVEWLQQQGYERIGIVGTSIGSCTAFLAFAHDERLNVGVFNHVSGYFADVTWRGISTAHVRAGFGDAVTLDELREYWLPISPFPYIERLQHRLRARPMRFIAARYDLTFPQDLSHDVIAEAKKYKLPLDVAWLSCGHYTSGETPWKFLDGWKIVTFLRKHL